MCMCFGWSTTGQQKISRLTRRNVSSLHHPVFLVIIKDNITDMLVASHYFGEEIPSSYIVYSFDRPQRCMVWRN